MREESMGKDMVSSESSVVGGIGGGWALQDVPSMFSKEIDFSKQKIRDQNEKLFIQYSLIQRPGTTISDRPVHIAL